MRKLLFYAMLSFTLISSSFSFAVDSEDIALAFVQKYNLGQKLTPVSYQYSTFSQIYRAIVNKVGEENAKRIVNSEIDKLIPDYQNQWNINLASSYAEVIGTEKLQSLFDEGSSSQYSGELIEKQQKIGELMMEKSTDLLNEIMTKALIAASNQMVQ